MASPGADEAEAGPATAVVFKKRGIGRTKVGVGIRSFAADDDASTPSTSSPNHTVADDEEAPRLSVEDLVALRTLRNKPQGIDLNRLNKGDLKKKKKKKPQGAGAQQTEEERWAEQMEQGGLITRNTRTATRGKGEIDDDHDDDGDSDEGKRKIENAGPRLIKENNFQGETGTVDVDKHMMAYIEEEMQKRRRGEAADETVVAAAKAANGNATSSRTAEDELYSIADKYQQIQQAAKDAIALARAQVHANGASQQAASNEKGHNDVGDDEGNVALSTSMLTSVPEIDLGMEVRMRNIEATEMARKALEEAQRTRSKLVSLDDSDFAAARFFRHPNREPSEVDRLRYEAARANSVDTDNEAGIVQATSANSGSHYKRRQTATDDKVLDRFKKRQREQLKR